MVLVPIIIGVLFVLQPLSFNRGERSISRRPWSVAIVVFVVLVVLTMWYEGKTAPWSPDLKVKPLSVKAISVPSGPVYEEAQLFDKQGCEACHTVAGQGGHCGPDLTTVADRLTDEQLKIRILNGGTNMPAFGSILTPQDLNLLLVFLESRNSNKNVQAMRKSASNR